MGRRWEWSNSASTTYTSWILGVPDVRSHHWKQGRYDSLRKSSDYCVEKYRIPTTDFPQKITKRACQWQRHSQLTGTPVTRSSTIHPSRRCQQHNYSAIALLRSSRCTCYSNTMSRCGALRWISISQIAALDWQRGVRHKRLRRGVGMGLRPLSPIVELLNWPMDPGEGQGWRWGAVGGSQFESQPAENYGACVSVAAAFTSNRHACYT